jgi:prolyl-tRNA synthetase
MRQDSSGRRVWRHFGCTSSRSGADEKANEIYGALTGAGIEVLYDDRDTPAGAKFAESDLLGLPYRIVIGKRSLESGKAEVKKRTDKEATEVAFEELVAFFKP